MSAIEVELDGFDDRHFSMDETSESDSALARDIYFKEGVENARDHKALEHVDLLHDDGRVAQLR